VFDRVLYPPGGTCGPRVQPDVQFVIIHHGYVTITLNHKRQRLPAGHICMLLPGVLEFFQFAEDQPTEHSWCAISFDRLPRGFNKQLSNLPFMLPMTANLQAILDLGLSLKKNTDQQNRLAITRLAETFFYTYITTSQGLDTNTPAYPQPVEHACRFIHENYESPMNLTDIAKAGGVTINHLIRLFRKHLQTTPSRYLWQTRTRCGIDLLHNTGLNISEIAYRVGFATPFHFSRLTKKYHGQSPKQLRQAHWQGKKQK